MKRKETLNHLCFFGILLLGLFIGCQSKTKKCELLKFKQELQGEFNSDLGFGEKYSISQSHTELKTTYNVYYNDACDRCCDEFVPSVKVSQDTLFLIVRYQPKMETREIELGSCTTLFKYETTCSNMSNVVFILQPPYSKGKKSWFSM